MSQILEYSHGKCVNISIGYAGSADAQRLPIEATMRNDKIAFAGQSGRLKIRLSDGSIRNGLTLFNHIRSQLRRT